MKVHGNKCILAISNVSKLASMVRAFMEAFSYLNLNENTNNIYVSPVLPLCAPSSSIIVPFAPSQYPPLCPPPVKFEVQINSEPIF